MIALTGFSERFSTSPRVSKQADATVAKMAATPAYKEFEAAVVGYQKQHASYWASEHNPSEEKAAAHEQKMLTLRERVQAGASKIHHQLVNDGVPDDQINTVMNALNDRANEAAEAASRGVAKVK